MERYTINIDGQRTAEFPNLVIRSLTFNDAIKAARGITRGDGRSCRITVIRHNGNVTNYECGCGPCTDEVRREIASEQYAEGAWLRAAEASTPESEAELREFDAEFPNGYGVLCPSTFRSPATPITRSTARRCVTS